MLKREALTGVERIDPDDLSYAKVIAGKYSYWVTAGMFLMLAWLFVHHAVELIQLLIFIGLVLLVPDATYSITSSWGGGAAAWTAVGFRVVFDIFICILVPTAFWSLWRHWRIAGRLRRGEL